MKHSASVHPWGVSQWAATAVLVFATSEMARADVFTNVAEATSDGYQLVYTLPIQNQASYNMSGSVPYSVNNSASITTPFDRVAYYMELDNGSGLQYAYASMDAFTTNVSQIGLPVDSTGANFQRFVSNLNVASNSSSVTTGTGIATGNIEFWPRNYGIENLTGVPNASGAVFDFGDGQHGGGNYGSFQVHNYGASETIFAYNQWGGEQRLNNGDLGIGNRLGGAPDWTFANNAATYIVKNLQVLVRPSSLSIDSGLERAVIQRNTQNQAEVPITGVALAGITSIEARATPRSGGPGSATGWQVIDASPAGGEYAGALTLDGGWYDLEVRTLNGPDVVDQRRVERLGVGEVFVIAGQSNSANFGNVQLAAQDDRVSSFDLNSWRHAEDPQPIADGGGGSPWPVLGDAIAADQNVPVGFISVGVGGTSVQQWQPGGSLYPRLKDALEALGPDGARAVLWHQGETDNVHGTSPANYAQRLEAIIAQSRADAGFDVPWGVAQASYHYTAAPSNPLILGAQAQVAANDPLNFLGAYTDDLINLVPNDNTWRWDNLHFNEAGLREHADRWWEALFATFDFVQFTGDFDSDDDVDYDDLAVWAAGFGATGGGASLADGDADGDQDVDSADFFAWQRNFGNSTGSSENGISGPTSVPEPATPTGLLVAVTVGVVSRTCRRRSDQAAAAA